MEDFNDNVNNEIDAVNIVKGHKNNGQFQKIMKQPENISRKKGVSNRKIRGLLELLGEYDPVQSLLD